MSISTVGAWTVYHHDAVDSTQRVAADLMADGVPDRTAVVANRQTAGYGRKGDVWLDAPGASLLVTLIVKPADASQIAHLAMVAALAIIDAIADTGAARAHIKWPNDILLNERKVAGILGDATWRGDRLDAVRLGIGLNIGGTRAVFARRSLPDATSISAETGRDVDRDRLLAALLGHFTARHDRLARGDIAQTVDAWRQSLATIGRPVVVTLQDDRIIRGIAEGATGDGNLIVVADDGTRHEIISAEARSLRHLPAV